MINQKRYVRFNLARTYLFTFYNIISASCGINTIMINPISSTKKNGMTALDSVGTLSPEILEPTNKFTPIGGVMNPIDSATIITPPKCIGSIPISRIIGNNIGVKIMTAADVSMNNPMISKSMMIKIISISSFSEIDRKPSATAWGILSIERTVPNAFAVPIISNITTELRAASLIAILKSLILISL